MEWLRVGAAGLLGVWGRMGLDRLTLALDWPAPAGTFGVNALGCLAAGFLLGVPSNLLSAEWRVPVMTGFLGGFTTYSAFSAQVVNFASRNELGSALFYGIATPTVAILAAWLGRTLSSQLF